MVAVSVVACALALAVLSASRPRVSFALFLVGFLLTAVPWTVPFPFDGRIISGIALISRLVLVGLSASPTGGSRRSPTFIVTPASVFVVLGAASMLWTTDLAESLVFVFSWVLFFGAVIIYRRDLVLSDIVRSSYLVYGLGMFSSLIILVMPGTVGWNLDGTRFEGAFNNPNYLAIVCLFATALALTSRSRLSIPVILAAVGLTVLAGSRAGLASIAIVLALQLVVAARERFSPVRAVGLAALASLAVGSLNKVVDALSGFSLLRDTDSRTEFWLESFRIIEENLPLGTGAGTGSAAYAASAYFLVLLDFGFLGIIPAVFSLGLLVRASAVAPRFMPLAFASVANSAFESWLFSAGSVFAVSLWIFCAFILSETDEQTSEWPPRDSLPCGRALKQGSIAVSSSLR